MIRYLNAPGWRPAHGGQLRAHGCRGCGAPADARRHRAGDRAEEDEGGGGSEGEEEEEEEEREGDWLDVAPLGGRLVAFAAEQLDHEVTITRGNGITRQR